MVKSTSFELSRSATNAPLFVLLDDRAEAHKAQVSMTHRDGVEVQARRSELPVGQEAVWADQSPNSGLSEPHAGF